MPWNTLKMHHISLMGSLAGSKGGEISKEKTGESEERKEGWKISNGREKGGQEIHHSCLVFFFAWVQPVRCKYK